MKARHGFERWRHQTSNRAALVKLDRIERLVRAGQKPDESTPTPDPILTALADTFGRNEFTSREAVEAAQEAGQRAETLGELTPDLPHELTRMGITEARAMGRYLSSLEGRGVSRIWEIRAGIVWQLDPDLAVKRGGVTAHTVFRIPCAL